VYVHVCMCITCDMAGRLLIQLPPVFICVCVCELVVDVWVGGWVGGWACVYVYHM